MSNVCCKEFQGWCKSFTRTEIFLCVLQAIFFVLFFAFLTFLILHLVVCSRIKQKYEGLKANNETNVVSTDQNNKEFENSTDSFKDLIFISPISDQNDAFTQLVQTDNSETAEVNMSWLKVPTTLNKGVRCTWKQSQPTEALTHYYEYHTNVMTTKSDKVVEEQEKQITEVNTNEINSIDFINDAELEDNYLLEDLPDGNEIYDTSQNFLLALVKIKPPQDVTFGCTLTIVNEYWTLTAASCIEAIEEVDSLDSFVMMQGFKEQDQSIHPVADVMIHPQYQGVNVTFDLAALKSEGRLVKKGNLVLKLPTLIDYFLISIGEALTILGYGRFRNIDKDPLARSVRAVSVHGVPLAQCPAGAGTWALRHLAGGAPAEHGACGASPLCAGVLRPRSTPCNYCSGTPLVKQDVLLGVMADNQHCGLSCEPALFVNLALVRDWLDSVLAN